MGAAALTRQEACARLAQSEPDIRALGVSRLALFGSVARNEARPDSDVDLLVQFAPGAKTYARFFALSELLEARLERRVELVTTESLSPYIGPRILAEAQHIWAEEAARRDEALTAGTLTSRPADQVFRDARSRL